eukprot:GHVU01126325.1.p1 GENE.GHVU01126325.1~~GHVU01126325.1.p1  ORF type:complete len:212 (-),score=60.99 GHVU01126325.1:1224-1859(-)
MFVAKLLTQGQFVRGIEKLVQGANDLIIDVPLGADRTLQFILWAVSDLVCPKEYLQRLPLRFIGCLTPEGRQLMEGLEEQEARVEKFKASVKDFLLDYTEPLQMEDARRFLEKHNEKGLLGHEFIRELVRTAAIDGNNVIKELASTTLSQLSDLTDTTDVARLHVDDQQIGFARLLTEIDDDKLDLPMFPDILAKFIGRAVVDECLPPSVI